MAPPPVTDSGLAWLGKMFLFGSILCQFSRLPEILVLRFGFFPPFLVTASGIIALLVAFLTGQFRMSRSAILFVLFTGWMAVAVVFSTWPGGSVASFTRFWLPGVVLNTSAATLVRTRTDLRKALYLLAASALIVTWAGITMGADMGEERLAVAGASTLSNGNDMCIFLLAGLPAVVMVLELRKGLWRVVALVCAPFVLYVIVLTGSRGAVVDLLVLWVLWFWRAPAMNKLKHLMVLFGGLFCIVTFAPASALVRYATILPFISAGESAHDAYLQSSAEGSSEIRKKLNAQGIDLAMRNPLFGVGPGVFQSAAAKDSEARGEKAAWFVNHNSYVQLASECGLPGFILYTMAVLFALGSLRTGMKRISKISALAELSTLGFYLLLVTVGNIVLSFFASVAYMPYFIIFAGLGDAYNQITETELHALPKAPVAPPMPVSRRLVRA